MSHLSISFLSMLDAEHLEVTSFRHFIYALTVLYYVRVSLIIFIFWRGNWRIIMWYVHDLDLIGVELKVLFSCCIRPVHNSFHEIVLYKCYSSAYLLYMFVISLPPIVNVTWTIAQISQDGINYVHFFFS